MSEVGIHREVPSSESKLVIDRPSGRRRSDRLVGAGRATQDVVDQAIAVAHSDRPVLICGPQGSGKEHLALAVHVWSSRAGGPLVVVSCTAVTESLLGRELFGCSEASYPTLPEEYTGGWHALRGGRC